MCRLALIFAAHLDSCNPPEVVARILAGPVDHQVLLFIHQVLPVKLSNLEVRRKLDGVSRAGLCAKTAEDGTREVDAEEFRVAPPVFVLSCLERDAIDGTRDRAEVAGHATLASIGIPRQNDPAPVAWREVRLLFRILNGEPFLKGMKKNEPDCTKYADHLLTHMSTTTPFRSKLTKASGNITFQPQELT